MIFYVYLLGVLLFWFVVGVFDFYKSYRLNEEEKRPVFVAGAIFWPLSFVIFACYGAMRAGLWLRGQAKKPKETK